MFRDGFGRIRRFNNPKHDSIATLQLSIRPVHQTDKPAVMSNDHMTTIGRMRRAIITILVGASVAVAQDNAADFTRLTEVLQVRPGSVVADIGAGPEALLTIPMATRVGPAGKVYATELGGLERLRQTVRKAGMQNVEVLEGDPSRTNLPTECCDAIFIRNVYHHFADPAAMNASLWKSLKSGGRLAIIDFRPVGQEAAPGRRDGGDQHGVSAATVIQELLQADFKLMSSEDRPDRWFLVVVEKPARR